MAVAQSARDASGQPEGEGETVLADKLAKASDWDAELEDSFASHSVDEHRFRNHPV